jgi:hypothetical protein
MQARRDRSRTRSLRTIRACAGGLYADARFLRAKREPAAPPAAPGRRCRAELQPYGGGHHRRPARAQGRDDLLGIDRLQVDAGRAEVRVPQLPLDDVQRHALAREFERMRVAQLVPTEAAPNAGVGGEPAELRADGGTRPRPAAGGAVDDAEQRADGQLGARGQPRAELLPAPTRPCRPPSDGPPCRCGPAATRGAGRGRVRRARAPPGRATRRAARR